MYVKKCSFAFLLTPLLLIGCGSDSAGEADSLTPQNAVFSLGVSDAAVDDLSAVVVCFNQLELKRSEADGGDLVFTVGEDPGMIAPNELCLDDNDQVIANTAGIDLMQVTGSDSLTLLNDTLIAAGDYSQMRLIISNGSYALDTVQPANKIAVRIPSNELKLDGFTAAIGGELHFTLEFDLRKAMTNPVGQQGYILKPRGVRLVDNSEIGHISGSVTESLLINNACTLAPAQLTTPVAAVYLYQGSDLQLLTLADIDGSEANLPYASTSVFYDGVLSYNFELGFVLAGDYTIAVTCDLSDLAEQDDDISFIEGQNVNVGTSPTPVEVVFGQ
jgi:hypothetical protein